MIGISLLAMLLRCWDLSAIAVEHFDEGVYASNLWFTADEGYRYPDRHLYAPPLLPTLIEWSLLIFGQASWVPALPSLVAGICTIPLIWWMGRKLGGPLCGLSAAILLATNDVHILYSRTALTEAVLCFFMLLSVSLAHCTCLEQNAEARFSKRSIMLALLSGLMAGLAWLTKYNGWLSLAVIISGSTGWALFSRLPLRQWKWLILHWLLIVGVAFFLWLPYMISLDEFGGYSAVAANHRQYFGGLGEWLPALQWQIFNQYELSSWTSIAGLLCVGFLTWNRSALVRIIPAINTKMISPSGCWLLASWCIGLSVAIPLYHAYPRLVVPWWIGICLLGGLMAAKLPVVQASSLSNLQTEKQTGWKPVLPYFGFIILSLLTLSGPIMQAPAWENRTELKSIAEKDVQRAGVIAQLAGFRENEVIFYVYGEPAIFYHISAQNRLVGPIGHLDFALPAARNTKVPTFLITGPHAEESSLFHEQWEKLGNEFELIKTEQAPSSRFVQLNNEKVIQQSEPDSYRLYQLKSL
ncbi:Dolichyl-phosphate-mannose-protein mannosyltransferase [Rubinisphaera italica]|uniref:Dolichyl-phosphate-mannose-protein mannosyltransferase n=1 Tax=Rubinisphaera italica TaxID=2527969 RepID=A0A5C5XMW2_9PLAN|nr:Dolichyl-phosphate-mannose-protein mannosyltransferase [Rubinisphaera italica]